MYKRDNLIIQIATLYYEEKLTQAEIAKKLHISRPTVSHMLNEARDRGIVTITIHHPDSNLYSKQHEIVKKYGLRTVQIANGSLSDENIKKELGQLCAQYIENRINDFTKLGLGWGTTIFEYINQATYTKSKNLEIIPLIGGIGIQDTQFHSNHLAFRLSEKYNCDVSYFYAPAFAESAEVRGLFESTTLYQDIYNKGLEVDIAILGVGNPIESSTYKSLGYFSKEEENQIRDSGAIGDILGSFFDKNGNKISIPITERMMGIALNDIHKIPEILVLASGKEKVLSIKILLEMGLLDHIIIDKEIADGLLNNEL
ncbi:sugar-binding transcriptional regulator [Ruoffia tabacinasalis]|uniref:Sugar-binding transcriptional regulator n=1 Tax=Ruoffia tabacinasalis TaxID=87458 RepID=A0A5R9DU71_9LACT|nr:sugar-binding transcriptional regulator [Ruoffia tabacinasalis]TLQ40810.1 sugar-binding transcriptional regulator [Ruoffia tabacinasalis]